MKKSSLLLAAALSLSTAPAMAGNVSWGINLNLGIPAQPVAVEHAPEFIVPPALGFSVAVGIPYDVVFIDNQYYAYRGNHWYCGPRYNGPWRSVGYRYLPTQLRHYPIKQIRYARDTEYRRHDHRGNYYGERHQRPDPYMEARHQDRRERYEGNRVDHGMDDERNGHGMRD